MNIELDISTRADDLLGALTGNDAANISHLFQARVKRSPNDPFLHWKDRKWTYREAMANVMRAAGQLAALGVRPGDRVSTYSANRPELVWIWLGVALCGAIYAPLNREQKSAFLTRLISRIRPTVLITDAPPDFFDPAQLQTRILLFADFETVEPRVRFDPIAGIERAPSDPAAWLFTSGTTGESKVVSVPHNQFCRGAANVATAFQLQSTDVFHGWLPLCHIAGLLHVMTTMIVVGGSVALYESFSASQFWNQVAQRKATVFAGFSNVLHYLLNTSSPEPHEHSLRIGMFSNISADLIKRVRERFGVVVWDSYDMTEASPITLPDLSRPAPPGSCGRPNPDLEVRILALDDTPLPSGEVGEICIRPKKQFTIFLGYEADRAATVEAFRNLHFHTGDLGKVDADGYVYHVGRKKDFVRRGGENVSLQEVESIIKQHDAISDCACIGVKSEFDDDNIKAVIVLADQQTVTPKEIHAYCIAEMARFMTPRYFEIRDSIDYIGVGKVDRQNLAKALGPIWDANA